MSEEMIINLVVIICVLAVCICEVRDSVVRYKNSLKNKQ